MTRKKTDNLSPRPIYYVAIGIEGSSTMIKHQINIPPSYFEKWHLVSFQFKQSDNGRFDSANMTIKGGMIWVKERWFHKVWNWIYWKFKKPQPAFAKGDQE